MGAPCFERACRARALMHCRYFSELHVHISRFGFACTFGGTKVAFCTCFQVTSHLFINSELVYVLISDIVRNVNLLGGSGLLPIYLPLLAMASPTMLFWTHTAFSFLSYTPRGNGVLRKDSCVWDCAGL